MSGNPVPPAVMPPGPPPQSPGMSTGKLVAIVIGVMAGIALVTVAGLVVVGYIFASRIHVTTVPGEHGREKTVRVDTPFGRLRVEKREDVDPKTLGIPVYPGATVVKDEASGARVDLDLDFADKSLRIQAVKMETPDSFDKVVDFYRNEAVDFSLVHKSGHKVEFQWERGRLKKVVGIEARRDKTRISLANIGEPEAN